MRCLKNIYHTNLFFLKKTIHSFDIVTTWNRSPSSFYVIFMGDYRLYNGFYWNNIFWGINVAPELANYRSFANVKFLFWHSTSKGEC